MNPEDPSFREIPPIKPEYTFATERDLAQEAGKINQKLSLYIGVENASKVSQEILRIAQRTEETIKRIMTDDRVAGKYTYDGSEIHIPGKFSMIRAYSGMNMLTYVHDKNIKEFLGNPPSEPDLESYDSRLIKMMASLSENYAGRAEEILKRIEKFGGPAMPLSAYNIEEVLSPMSPDQKETDAEGMKNWQDESKIQRKVQNDPFFQGLEREMDDIKDDDKE